MSIRLLKYKTSKRDTQPKNLEELSKAIRELKEKRREAKKFNEDIIARYSVLRKRNRR
jgi:hypothetical protein